MSTRSEKPRPAVDDLSRPFWEAAQDLGVSHATARNQLAAGMAKLGVHRQAELVALLAALAP